MKDPKAILARRMHIAGVEAKSACKTASMYFIVCNARGLADVKWELLRLGTTPCVSTICLSDFILRGQIFQAFPLPCLDTANAGGGNSLGMKLYKSYKFQKFLPYGIEIRHYT